MTFYPWLLLFTIAVTPINLWCAIGQTKRAQRGLDLLKQALAVWEEADKAREEARRLHAITLELLKGRD